MSYLKGYCYINTYVIESEKYDICMGTSANS